MKTKGHLSVCLSVFKAHIRLFKLLHVIWGPSQNPGRGPKGAFFSQAQALRHFLTRATHLSLVEAENKQLWCPTIREPPQSNPLKAVIIKTDPFTLEDL